MDRERYLREAGDRVSDIRERLDNLKSHIDEAVSVRQARTNERLRKSQQQADAFMSTLVDQLESLKTEDGETWAEALREFEQTWDGLAETMRKIVARFSN